MPHVASAPHRPCGTGLPQGNQWQSKPENYRGSSSTAGQYAHRYQARARGLSVPAGSPMISHSLNSLLARQTPILTGLPSHGTTKPRACEPRICRLRTDCGIFGKSTAARVGNNGVMRNFLRDLQGELKRAFTGSVDALPEWVPRLAEGDDAGYHLPGSAVWAVHGSMTPIVGGIRALLMQALHPGALAGIHEHSDFRTDPLSRLARTIRWIFTVTYGSTAAAEQASARVRRLHEPVQGNFRDRQGSLNQYSANDPELARWVHIAFVDAFLTSHKIWGGKIPGGPDAYVREWAQAGRLMGVDDPPLTEADMRQQLDRYFRNGELLADNRVAETVGFLRNPPLHPLLRPGYRIIFAGAVYSLEPQYRQMLGLEVPRLGPFPLPVRLATKVTLGVVHLALGRRPGPSEQAARARLRRLGYEAADPAGGKAKTRS